MGWKENELELEFELESNGSFGYRDGFCAHLGFFCSKRIWVFAFGAPKSKLFFIFAGLIS